MLNEMKIVIRNIIDRTPVAGKTDEFPRIFILKYGIVYTF